MKKILGLDLGTNSIGWAVVNEAESSEEQSSIVKLGVRVNPLTVDELTNFEKGKSITTAADRTSKRSMRRNLQRYKLRRESLINILKEQSWIDDDTILSEQGNKSTFETYRLRAKAVTEKISLVEFARVLLMINKKRGYKSSRKAKSNDEGQLIDGMSIAKSLYENDLTPGQYMLQLLKSGKNPELDFYRSDLRAELDRVWAFQSSFYPNILNPSLREAIEGRNSSQTWAICKEPFQIVGIKRETKGVEQKIETYSWRSKALSEQINLEQLAIVLQEINKDINSSSGYLGDISDRSKELYFNQQTVGQYLMSQLEKNSHFSLANQVFYRQDYLDEFETIWEKQATFYSELTPKLKKEIRDIVIFYQRPLKSQKGLISLCEFENREVEVLIDGKKKLKRIGMRVCPKSSPFYQAFRTWQVLNNLIVSDQDGNKTRLSEEEKQYLFNELQINENLKKSDVLKLLFPKDYRNIDLNFKQVEGNRTMSKLFKVYESVVEMDGDVSFDFSKMTYKQTVETIESIFRQKGINTDILYFDLSLVGKDSEQQASYKLWHLLYSYEGDKSAIGNESLIKKLESEYGFSEDAAKLLAGVTFEPDYGSLSTKAIRKILPYMMDGKEYSEACTYAGYRHSKASLTKEELDNKVLKDKLDLLPHNSLRNPVVEKILNQMVNVVNSVIDTYGKPDEIRIELARELKKSAKERAEMTTQINATSALHEKYKKILQEQFGISNVSRNDILRYKLYLELKDNGFKTLYSNTYISEEKLFSKEFDIEHIIPQSKLFDDSFANKTLEARNVNIIKGNATAYDYVASLGEDTLSEYKNRVEKLLASASISKTKYKHLLMKESEIPSGFINRDLRDSQYIARKAREILEELVKFVVPTTGAVTDRLREDWQLVNVMRELNWDKYEKLGLTYFDSDKDGRQIPIIKDWTKRNDHRHHAMDALTIAFTKRSYIQYLNNLNARVQKYAEEYIDLDLVELSSLSKEQCASAMYAIEKKELYRDGSHKLRFTPPMPLNEFRAEAKRQLENVLVSIKAKNKVVTRNINSTKKSGGKNQKVQLTPRGQLHLETVYGSHKQYAVKEERLGASFNEEKIMSVANKAIRLALLKRLHEFDSDPKKAFTGKNAIAKNPIWLDEEHSAQVPERIRLVSFEHIYTIRKEVGPDLKLDKVVDTHVREILQARLAEFNDDAKKAFSNLDENPIYLNKEKGITIKRVTITGISNAIALHDKRDKDGKLILDEQGNKCPVDFVNTGNNHHIAIYRDADGNLQENVVSFYEATARINQGLPVIDKEYRQSEGWTFLFSMKQNEYFVFPNEATGFNPSEIDLINPDNYELISPNLYRVQKITNSDYVFRHHLETTVNDSKELKGIAWKRIRSTNNIKSIVKVRVNHIGHIVSVGEY